jgi:hypothetical protein
MKASESKSDPAIKLAGLHCNERELIGCRGVRNLTSRCPSQPPECAWFLAILRLWALLAVPCCDWMCVRALETLANRNSTRFDPPQSTSTPQREETERSGIWGVDLHRTQFTVCTRLENGKTYLRQWPMRELKLFAARLTKEDELAVESTGNTRLFHDAVVKQVARVAVVNPSQFKLISQLRAQSDWAAQNVQHCTDPTCYQSKIDVHVRQTIATKPKLIQISTAYGAPEEGGATIPRNKYIEIRQEKPERKEQRDSPEYKICKYTRRSHCYRGR